MTLEHVPDHYPPNAPELAKDPFGGRPVWMITRHEDVNAVVTDRRLVMNCRSLPGGTDDYVDMMVAMGVSADLAPYIAGNLVHVDPPDHTRLRKLVSRAFSARRITALRPRIEAIAGELLDALPGHASDGAVDLIEHFAYPLPITVICELLGVPVEDRPKWRGWSRDCASMNPARMNTMLADISAYILDLADQRRAEPADDLITGLTQAHDEDSDRLSDTELVTMVMTLVIAGHETTAHLIGNGIAGLLAHPDQLALLREDPSLMPAAVQEILRWGGPAVTAMLRHATEDVAIGDVTIKAGDRVQAVLSAANHDPQRYPDAERLDVTRLDATGVQHLAYSNGLHYCLGARLANEEAEVALAAVLDRYPDLALAVPPDGLEWQPLPFSRQLIRLPVTLGSPHPSGVTPVRTH
jgi:cytochrome P450